MIFKNEYNETILEANPSGKQYSNKTFHSSRFLNSLDKLLLLYSELFKILVRIEVYSNCPSIGKLPHVPKVLEGLPSSSSEKSCLYSNFCFRVSIKIS